MCFRDFYTGINNIRLGFIGIESKISREEARNIACPEDWFTEVKHSFAYAKEVMDRRQVSGSPRQTNLRLCKAPFA